MAAGGLQGRRMLKARAVMSNDGLAGAAAGLRGGGSVRSVRVALVSSNSLLVAESATPDNNLSELITTLPNPFSARPRSHWRISNCICGYLRVANPPFSPLPDTELLPCALSDGVCSAASFWVQRNVCSTRIALTRQV